MNVPHKLHFFLLIGLILLSSSHAFAFTRQMENLSRSPIAIKISSGVMLGWRSLGTDSVVKFNIYRGTSGNYIKVNASPIKDTTCYVDRSGVTTSTYKIVPVVNGAEDTTGVKAISTWSQSYLNIPLNRPAGGKTEPNKSGSVGKAASGSFPKGQYYGYSPNDCSVGDLDGDGEYEIVVKWDPSNSQDNSYYGITGKVYLDAYKLNGTQLWRIDLGKNIRAGAHYT